MSVSLSVFPASLIPVSIGPAVLALALLLIVDIFSVISGASGFASVNSAAVAQTPLPVSFVPVPILPLHHAVALRRLVLPLAIVAHSPVLVIPAVVENAAH